jgi:N-acetylglucosaminyldiphosphoundecaprenol N-acetyl-beta-D-mannosaminyltransferase
MIDHGKRNLLGVRIDAVDYEAAVSRIVDAAQQDQPYGVSALAVHGVMTGALDATHRHRLNALELIVPDGQPVRWGLNLLHRVGLKDRVYGPNLMLYVCEKAAQCGLPIVLFGGKQETLDDLENKLREKFPLIQIADKIPSKFRQLTQSEKSELVERIAKSGGKITMVGIGCPRQEVWAYEFKQALSMPVLAVGAAFSFHAGHLDQAPASLQRLGLEWLYRFVKEPKRLWKRYVFLNPLYLSMLFLQWTRLRKYDPAKTSPPQSEILYG